jgi:potassium efflux system protein
MHVRDLGDRNPVLDEINRFINKEFKKQKINISFRQMEVYLKNMQGQEYKMVPIEPEQKSIAAPAAVPAAPKDVPEPPDVKLD